MFLLFLLFLCIISADHITASSHIERRLTPKVRQYVLKRRPDRSCFFLYSREFEKFRLLTRRNETVTQIRSAYSGEHGESHEYLLVYGYNDDAIALEVSQLCEFISIPQEEIVLGSGLVVHGDSYLGDSYKSGATSPILPEPPSPLEVSPLYTSGESENRIDLIFFGDGYTLEEKGKFLNDAKRLADDLVVNQTFATVKPLLNIWAAFTPSNESGIGVGGKAKDTVYGLYRNGTQLRAILAEREPLAHAACLKLRSKCDYPILLGNDPLYGGIGGLVTITTSSQENGPLVLRHELGHSIIEVGEEYDGGFGYFGVNSDNTTEGIKWSHWLSKPSEDESNSVRSERSVMPLQVYAWSLLNHTEPYTATFTSSGTFSRHLFRFSLSGLPNVDDLKVTLDGKDLGWEPKPGIGIDRWHYNIYRETALGAGEHTLQFALQSSGNESIAQLCSFEILEYGNEEEFNTSPGYIGAYPTYSATNETTYRPTNEQCPMRQVTSSNFCSPCIEGLWRSLFTRLALIDDFVGNVHPPDEHSDTNHTLITFGFLPVGQFRNRTENNTLPGNSSSSPLPKEHISITYSSLESKETFPKYQDSPIFVINEDDYGKWFYVEAEFHTEEVRSDPNKLLTYSVQFMALGPKEDQMEAQLVFNEGLPSGW